MGSEVAAAVAAVAVAFPVLVAWVAALGEDWSLSAIAASAAFLFRVRRGVVNRGDGKSADGGGKGRERGLGRVC